MERGREVNGREDGGGRGVKGREGGGRQVKGRGGGRERGGNGVG